MRRILLCLWLIIYCSLLFGNNKAIIRSITISGNHLFTTRQLQDIMVLKPHSIFSPSQLSQDIQSISNHYYKIGYYFADVQIDSLIYQDDSSSVDVKLIIFEREQVRIVSINISGNTLFSNEEILKKFDTQPGKFLVPSILEEDINALISVYDESGYPFSKVSVQNISPERTEASTNLRLDISIDEGKRITVDEIRVVGNKVTKENVIVRETRYKLHELYNQDKISRIVPRLNRMNIFSKVEEPELYTDSVGGGLLIKVEEGNTNTFDGIIGYAPGVTASEKGVVTGMINISMRNLFGTARKLNVHWYHDQRKSQEISLQYVEPWVFNLPINVSTGFTQRQEDTIYVRRSLDLKTDLLLTESFSLGGTFSQENIIPSNATNAVFKSQTTSTGIDIQYDTRDDIISPTGGVNYRSGYLIGSKQFSNQSVTVQRLSLDTDFFISLYHRQVAMLGLHGRSISSGKIELGDLYRFGGTNTLRGYRENQFLGSRIVWTNAEYRFILARHSFFYGFFDTGYYFLPGDDAKNIASSQRVKYGYGIGIRLETQLGNIGVGFAFGEGDSFLQGKIHIGLINEF
jgi:outer membrane protein insertion porin family